MRVLLCVTLLLSVSACGPAAWVLEPILALVDMRYESYSLPSEGMLPTLRVDDRFFVDEAAYSERDPLRGEVVVFTLARDGGKLFPSDERPGLPRELFTMRIVALPGDTAESDGGRLVINGRVVREELTEEVVRSQHRGELAVSIQELDTGPFRIVRRPGGQEAAIPPTRVPEDRYFVLGDYRDNSNDSRFWGTVRRSEIVGPATNVYWSESRPTWRRVHSRPLDDGPGS